MHLSFHCLKVNILEPAMDGRVFINETMVQPTRVTGYKVFLVLLRRAVQFLQSHVREIYRKISRFNPGSLR